MDSLVTVDNVNVEVLGIAEERALAKHQRVLDLQHRVEKTYFELAEELYDISSERLFKAIGPGYNSFEEYVTKELGLGYRKAKYLASIWWWFGEEQKAHPALTSLATEIGWTKARELVEVVDVKNVEKWRELATTSSKKELTLLARAALKEAAKRKSPDAGERPKSTVELSARGQGGSTQEPGTPSPDPEAVDDPIVGTVTVLGVEPPAPETVAEIKEADKEAGWHNVTFAVTREHRETIEMALEVAGVTAESAHRGHLLSLIALHFCSSVGAGGKIDLGEWFGQVERATGLKLVAIDPKERAIVYGDGTLRDFGIE